MEASEFYGQEDAPFVPVTTQADAWHVIKLYFKDKGLVRMQIDSFDKFLFEQIPSFILETKGQLRMETNNTTSHANMHIRKKEVTIEMSDIRLHRPSQSTPMECRLRGHTYEGAVMVSVTKRERNKDDNSDWSQTQERVTLCRIPTMLKSKVCNLSKKKPGSDSTPNHKELAAMSECIYDQGGYFVVNGSEKVLIAQERRANNMVFVFKRRPPGPTHMAEIVSFTEKGNKPVSVLYLKLVGDGVKSKREVGVSVNRRIMVKMPYIKEDVPIVFVFRALGFCEDKEILQMVCYSLRDQQMLEAMQATISHANENDNIEYYKTKEGALDYIGTRINAGAMSKEKRIQAAKNVFHKEVLPHIGIEISDAKAKGFFFGYMCNKLLSCALNRSTSDERDHFANKRCDLAGPLLGSLFKLSLKRLIKNMRKEVQNKLDKDYTIDIESLINDKEITKDITRGLATGNWAVGKDAAPGLAQKTGVAQVLSRLTFAATLSNLRRTNTPIGRDGKMAAPRQLHNTQWGVMCPAETPEGSSVGLVKNMALMCHFSVDMNTTHSVEKILDFAKPLGLIDLLADIDDPARICNPDVNKVFMNGVWMGVTDNAKGLVEKLRSKRIANDNTIDPEVSIVRLFTEREIRINTDPGRCMRPLFVVDSKPHPEDSSGERRLFQLRVGEQQISEMSPDTTSWTWDRVIEDGLCEYIDVEEEETIMIAMEFKDLKQASDVANSAEQYRYTHCEMHPAVILGVCASIIPFPDHNQSPRNCYQSAMGKQAMGVYAANFLKRMDTIAHVLWYPMKPLVKTESMEFMRSRDLPSGQNAIVAIASYTGYNQEDSLIMNLSSIDRGFMRSMYYKYVDDTCKRKAQTSKETWENPQRVEEEIVGNLNRKNKYHDLDIDGFCPPGTKLFDDHVLFGKTSEDLRDTAMGSTRRKKDLSKPVTQKFANWTVDQVMVSYHKEKDCKIVKIRLRQMRTPQMGDKFASRHGQKGTVGMTFGQEDMPFTCEGIVPDIIMNPHAVPSRMTIGQMVECIQGKVGSLIGEEADATPFGEATVERTTQELHKRQYQREGYEVMYNGHTGRRMTTRIFFGPTYYQRLKHLVDDKIFARNKEKTQGLTRQPTMGRSRGGGLRFGEMERDCIIAHGSANFLKERLFYQSDAFEVHVCNKCGLMCKADMLKHVYECKACANTQDIARVEIPYACKLLFQELMSITTTTTAAAAFILIITIFFSQSSLPSSPSSSPCICHI